MNAIRLLDDFDRVINTPAALVRLRGLILDLAVRGRLVPQDANDEPASVLLARIATEKARLVGTGATRSDRQPLKVDPAAFPVRPPSGWALARLATISRRIHYGFTASADVDLKEVRMLRITDIQDNEVNWLSVPGCSIDPETVDQFKLEKGDILIARTGGTIGKTFLVRDLPVTAVFASYLIRVQSIHHMSDEFLKLFMESSLYWDQLREGTRGTGQPNVNSQTLGRLIVPLPPLSEQHRIAAKLAELMALCDQFEVALTNSIDLRRRLLDALVHDAVALETDSTAIVS